MPELDSIPDPISRDSQLDPDSLNPLPLPSHLCPPGGWLHFSDLFLAVLVFVAACRFSLVASSGGYSLVTVHGLLTAAPSLVAEHGL